MSAERLREAAASLRSSQEQYAPGYEDRFELAIADWLERTADDHDQWYGVRAACRELNEAGEETAEGVACDCSYKDCYEHGKWHNCTHGEPDITPALAVANAYLGSDQ